MLQKQNKPVTTCNPIVKVACQLSQYRVKVRLHIDKLRVDRRTYTVEIIFELSAPLNPATLTTKVDKCLVIFF